MALLRRGDRDDQLDVFSRFDRMFDEWTRALPFGRTGSGWWPGGEDVIRVDEYRDGDTLVIRADLPGVNPDEDIDLDVVNGMLRLRAERRSEEDRESGGYLRRELRYGSFARTLPLPEGVTESDISASYRDGILEVRVPMPKAEPAPERKRISIARG